MFGNPVLLHWRQILKRENDMEEEDGRRETLAATPSKLELELERLRSGWAWPAVAWPCCCGSKQGRRTGMLSYRYRFEMMKVSACWVSFATQS